jgi:hypothetical protein
MNLFQQPLLFVVQTYCLRYSRSIVLQCFESLFQKTDCICYLVQVLRVKSSSFVVDWREVQLEADFQIIEYFDGHWEILQGIVAPRKLSSNLLGQNASENTHTCVAYAFAACNKSKSSEIAKSLPQHFGCVFNKLDFNLLRLVVHFASSGVTLVHERSRKL